MIYQKQKSPRIGVQGLKYRLSTKPAYLSILCYTEITGLVAEQKRSDTMRCKT